MNIILITKKEKEQGLTLSDKRALHITKILKKKEKENFSLGIEGEKEIWECSFSIEKEKMFFTFNEIKSYSPPLAPITLILGLSRPLVMKRILKDTASLGIEKLIIVKTELSDKSYLQSSLWKGEVHDLLREGAIQAKSTYLPTFYLYTHLEEALQNLPREKDLSRWVLHPYDNSRHLLKEDPSPAGVIVAIGSERGWTKREINFLEENNFISLCMGKRILRTETATLASLYFIQEKCQENSYHWIQK